MKLACVHSAGGGGGDQWRGRSTHPLLALQVSGVGARVSPRGSSQTALTEEDMQTVSRTQFENYAPRFCGSFFLLYALAFHYWKKTRPVFAIHVFHLSALVLHY